MVKEVTRDEIHPGTIPGACAGRHAPASIWPYERKKPAPFRARAYTTRVGARTGYLAETLPNLGAHSRSSAPEPCAGCASVAGWGTRQRLVGRGNGQPRITLGVDRDALAALAEALELH